MTEGVLKRPWNFPFRLLASQKIMGLLEERDLSDVPTISEFFKGKRIFITGGSGFMGKVLIEKLLYSCTDLDKIYLLLRNKKGVSPAERLQKMYSIPCFDRLRKERPGVFESKVEVLAGDVSEVGLGLSPQDREVIIKNVNIIYHVAASVRFDEPLPVSANMNLRSAIEVMEIAKEMKNLNVLVHVSTAYANIKHDPIEEKMYPPYADWRETLNICQNVDEKTLNILTPKYILGLPNTYVFMKQLAEHAVYEQRGKLPIIMIRPSVVVPSIKEPIDGWIENFNGPMGMIVGAGKGLLRCLYSSKDFSVDYVPVDVCIRHFIVAAWIRGTKKLEHSDEIEIYNCCSKERITNDLILANGREVFKTVPLEPLWTLNVTFTRSKLLYFVGVLATHLLPAIFVDIIQRIYGKRPMLTKLQRKIYISNISLEKFLNVEWDFRVDNFIKLRSCLKKEDMQEFYYDFKNFFTTQYTASCVVGSKKFLLNEKEENIPKTLLLTKRIYFADKIIRYSVYGVAVWAFITSKFVFNLYENMISKVRWWY